MSKKNHIENDMLVSELLTRYGEDALSEIKESNKHASKRNRLAKRQYQQSVLNYEQLERQYLIEKSTLQPSFRLSVTELLMCQPDFLNDPEVASEATYLANLGVDVDQRVLRLSVEVTGDAEYWRPNMIIGQFKTGIADERVDSMSGGLYFAPIDSIDMTEGVDAFPVYFVYRDKTTLPVIHKYRVTLQRDSSLRRWEVTHLDTIYASSHENLSVLNSSSGCAALFRSREEA